MKAFRILLALAVAGATFYSLNVLAVQNGFRDRLDFSNKNYHDHHCSSHGKVFNHHRTAIDPVKLTMDSINQK